MNILLIFFAIPLAIIILSAILESFVNCPIKVAGIFFAIFIVLAFAFGGTAELIVAVIVYTLLAFIVAAIIRYIINRRYNCNCNLGNDGNCFNTCNFSNNVNDGLSLNSLNYLNNMSTFNRIGNGGVISDMREENNGNILANETNIINSRNIGNNCRRCR